MTAHIAPQTVCIETATALVASKIVDILRLKKEINELVSFNQIDINEVVSIIDDGDVWDIRELFTDNGGWVSSSSNC